MNLDTSLSAEETDWMEDFLQSRYERYDDAELEEKDLGIFDIPTLDGFVTAIVSGPVFLAPSRWMPELWGEVENVWESVEEAQKFTTMLMRHANGIAQLLMDRPSDFDPVYFEIERDGETYWRADEWCEGYMRGVDPTFREWEAGGAEMTKLLLPILVFSGSTEIGEKEALSRAEADQLQNSIAPNVRAIHAYWLEKRSRLRTPIRREEPSIRRNDPCPCGSGRRYKHCCLT